MLAEPAALRGNIDERDRPFVDTGVLIHGAIFMRIFGWRMILSENRYPLFGIMRIFSLCMILSENRQPLFGIMH